MALELFLHPFSSYCHKALIALYENATPFSPRLLEQGETATWAEFATLSPMGKFPLLRDGDKVVAEATIIIEYLQSFHPGPARLIPDDPALAIETRFLDRFFDNYVHAPMQAIVSNALRKPEDRSAKNVEDARATLERAYGWVNERMATREWANGVAFSLADCAAAPALFYADWAHPIGEAFPHALAYRARLNARPAYARAIEQARPYRPIWPLGAPGRD